MPICAINCVHGALLQIEARGQVRDRVMDLTLSTELSTVNLANFDGEALALRRLLGSFWALACETRG